MAKSSWRRKRLLILCYHGVALRDEHLADPALYVSASFLRRRLERLQGDGYRALHLSDALSRLGEGTLPSKSVVLTFDDGTRDFAEMVVPLLREFATPATVYVTTYYCEHPMPVFDTALRYLLWRGRHIDADVGRAILGGRSFTLGSEDSRRAAWVGLYEHAKENRFSAADKQDVLKRVAEAVGVDFDDFLASGMYQQMTPDEIRRLPSALVDVQLHTHRHRAPRTRELFAREIAQNREALSRFTGHSAFRHFCYPSGDYWGEFVEWLLELGVDSATTCVPGLATAGTNPLLLPRFLDSSLIGEETFDAWTSGVAALLPRRSVYRFAPDRLADTGGAKIAAHVRTR